MADLEMYYIISTIESPNPRADYYCVVGHNCYVTAIAVCLTRVLSLPPVSDPKQ